MVPWTTDDGVGVTTLLAPTAGSASLRCRLVALLCQDRC
jgi:hypothetical protein